MASGPDRTGVCILRVWVQDGGVVIRIRARYDTEDPSTERTWATGDIEDALRLVRDFLAGMATGVGGARAPTPP